MKHTLLAVAGLLAVTVTAHAFEQNDLDKLKATGSCERCDLNFAYMKHASLKGSNLARANLTDAGLRLANISGANLRDVSGLTQGQLDMACGDGNTVLPSGLKVAPCR